MQLRTAVAGPKMLEGPGGPLRALRRLNAIGRGRLLLHAGSLVPFLALAPLLVALDRPISVDDPAFLKSASQIRLDALHPLGGTINWYGEPAPLWFTIQDPPGLGYWLAAVETAGGTRERILHLSLLPFSVAAALAGWRLAKRFTGAAPWTAVLWLASPAFLVSASTLMADVPALALALWGVSLSIEGVDADRRAARSLGALLAGISVLVKYTALLTLPAMALYALLMSPPARRWRRVADLWPALLPPAAWSMFTLATDGRLHMADSLFIVGGLVALDPGSTMVRWFLHRAIASLTFIAASGIFPALFVASALREPAGRRLACLAATLGIGAGLVSPSIWAAGPGWMPFAVGALASLGALALLATVSEAWIRIVDGRDRETTFLAAWVGLHVGFIWLGSWTVAVRYVLPMLPPLAMLLVRARHARPARLTSPSRAAVTWPLAATAVATLTVSVLLLRADAAPADFHRQVLRPIVLHARSEGRQVYFAGSWGFQYYAERAGIERLDNGHPSSRAGDIILQPYYAANGQLPDRVFEAAQKVWTLPGPVPPFALHTMNPFVGSGFYSSVFGPLPYSFGREPAEGVKAWLMVRDP